MTKSDSAIVRELAKDIHKTMRRGPRAMRLPGGERHGGGEGVGHGRNTFTPYSLYPYEPGVPFWDEDRHSWRRMKALFRRAMKKAAQPFRRKDRGRMRRKAAGKNEVRSRGH